MQKGRYWVCPEQYSCLLDDYTKNYTTMYKDFPYCGNSKIEGGL